MSTTQHPYALFAGGTDDEMHNGSVFVPRDAHLVMPEEHEASFCTVVNDRGMHRLYYELHGGGPRKLLLLMGLAGTHTAFEPQLLHFGITRAEDFTVCLVDNRGIGASDTPPGRWTTSDLASDCLQLLMWLEKEDGGWKSCVHLLGFSMGGMAAQELVLMDPSRFASLTLLSTHSGGLLGTIPPFHGLSPMLKCFGGGASVRTLDGGLEMLFPKDHLKDDVPRDALHPDDLDDENFPMKTWRHFYAKKFIRRARKYQESWVGPEMRMEGVLRQVLTVMSHYISWKRLERIRSYKLRILVVSGGLDNLVGDWNARFLAEAVCGKWLHFADAGHGVSEQYANEVNAAIEDLIQEAQESYNQSQALNRKPCPAGMHPVQIVLAWFAVKILISRVVPPRIGTFFAAACAAVHLRRKFGGFFAP